VAPDLVARAAVLTGGEAEMLAIPGGERV